MPSPLRPLASASLAGFLLLVCLWSLVLTSKTSAQSFVHPGLLHTEADFLRMKTKVDQQAQPWLSGWNALTNDWNSQLGAGTRAVAEITRPGNVGQMYIDINHAYACALRWKVSGDTLYADEAVRFLNAWSSTMTSLTGNADRFLAAGIHGYQWANIAEIMRTYPGWPPADITRFQNWLLAHFYSLNESFLWGKDGGQPHNGAAVTNYWSNWDLCNMASALAIGVFCDRRDIYDRAMAYIYAGDGNGALDRVIYQLHDGNLGQMQESGRDQGHTTLSISLLGVICEMAWNQGVDLYGYRNHRVLSAAEYVTRYNFGHDVPYDSYMWGTGQSGAWQIQTNVSSAGRPSHRPWAEMIYNHYVNRLGLAAPFTQAEAEYMRPEGNGGNGDQLGWGTLTFTREPIAQGANPKLSVVQRAGDVVLSWWGSAYATSYHIKRATSPGGPYVTLAAGVTGITSSYTDSAPPTPGAYYYVVTGVLPSGQETGPSNEVRVAFPAELTTWLQADETSGTTASDSSGRGRHGTLVNGPTWVPGKTGNAIALDGVDDHVSLPADVVGSLADFTLATWVYLDEARTWSRIFDFGGKPGSYLFLTPRSNTGGTRFAITTVYGYNEQSVEGPAIPVGQWTHVAVTLSGRVATLYINGLAVARKLDCFLQPLQLGDTPQNWIGRSQFAHDPYLKGKIDDFRIYDYALRGHKVHALGAQGTNQAPAFTGEQISLPAATEDAPYAAVAPSLATYASDPDGPAPTFTKLDGPTWLAIAANGALSGTPTNADVGLNTFLVRATDSSGAGEVARLKIEVVNTNDAPAWSSDPIIAPPVSQNLAYTGTLIGNVTDVDVGSSLTFAKISGPAWLAIAANGALSGTPSASDIGTNSFVVRATDNTGAFTDVTLNISVLGDVLVARYLLDGSGADSQGGAALAVSGSAIYAPGATGQALVFNGSSNFATVPIPSPVVYKDFTFAAWVWWDGGAIWQRIFDFGNGTSEYLFLSPAGGSGMRFEINANGIAQGLNAPALPTGTWAHVAVTLGGDTATIYVNGVAVATSDAITNDPTSVNLVANYLGKSQWPDPLFAGKLDDVRLYNHALGASSIAALVHGIPSITPSGLSASPLSDKVTLTWKTGANAQSYTVKRSTTNGGPYTTLASGLTSTTYVDTAVTTGTTYYYVVTSTNSFGESANSAEIPAVVSHLRVRLKFNESAGTVAADASGNGFNGAFVNNPTLAAGLFANSVTLPNTAGQHVALPAGIINGLTDFTISTWAKVDAFATWQRIFDFGTGTNNYLNLAAQGPAGSGRPRFTIRTSAGVEQFIDSSVALTAGAWAHLAVTRSGTAARLYINGVLVGNHTGMSASPADLGVTTQNYLGRSQFSNDPYLNGSLDDFRIYSRALSAAEIAAQAAPAPDVPASLSAIPGVAQVILSWPLADYASTYTVKRATTSGGPYTTVVSGLAATSYVDTGVASGTTYHYVVCAANFTGESVGSPEAIATPQASVVNIVGGGVSSASQASGNSVEGSDKAFDLNTGSKWLGGNNGVGWLQYDLGETGAEVVIAYDITSANDVPERDPMDWQFLGSHDGSSWTTLDTRSGELFDSRFLTKRYYFSNNIAYRYYRLNITANRGGATYGIQLSELALLRFVILEPAPDAPTALVATAISASRIDLSWPVSANAWGYVVKRATVSGGPYVIVASGVSGTAYSDTGLAGHTLYYYVVSALGSGGESGDSPQASATTLLGPPSALTATPGAQQVALSWTAASGAVGYNVKRSLTSGGPYVLVAGGVTATGYTETGLVDGNVYYYVVSSVNADGESVDGTEVSATPGVVTNDRFTELFGSGDANDTASTTFTFTPANNANGYTASRASASVFPTDPAGGTTPSLGDDASSSVTLTGGKQVSLFGTAYSTLYVGSNGYITFGSGDSTYTASTSAHFNRPRVSALFDDLDPTAGGSVSWKQLSDRVAVTWQSIREYNASTTNSFQIELFFDGRVRITLLSIAATDGLIGLSRGTGVPSGFVESNFSAYPSIPAAPGGVVATGGAGQVALSWNAVSGATGYRIKRSTTSGSGRALIAVTAGASHVDTQVLDGATYYYTISALNVAGEGADSSEASATTYTIAQNWRLAHFGTISSSGNAADSADPDGDGWNNAQEFASGTDPNNRASALKIAQMQASGGDMVVSFATVSGKTYRIERSDTLENGTWTTVIDDLEGTGGTVQVTDPGGAAQPKRFYRIAVR